jgi:hypothetical protein
MRTVKSVYLDYCDTGYGGRSNKVFHVHIIDVERSFMVVTENGRRGSKLTRRILASNVRDYTTAERILNEKVRAKLNHPSTPYNYYSPPEQDINVTDTSATVESGDEKSLQLPSRWEALEL